MKKLIPLIAIFIISLTNNYLSYSQTNLLTNIEEYYKFDETSGTTAVNIVSNTGVNNGSVSASIQQTGKINSAYYFDGSTKVTYSGSSNWNIQATGALSISVWVKLSANIGGNGYGNIWGNESTPSFYLKYANSQYQLGWYTGGSIESLSNVLSFSLNTWYHFVLVKNGNSISFYQNNQPVGTFTAQDQDVTNSPAVYIGSDLKTPIPEGIIGYIDEIGIWKRVLGTDDINTLYNSGNGFSYPFGLMYTLTTAVSGDGVLGVYPSYPFYSSGTVVSIVPISNPGYTFTSWSGDLTGSSNPGSITMNANKSVTANFTPTGGNQAPVASNVSISGSLVVGQTITGSFTYTDAESNPPGTHLYKWYKADNSAGSGQIAISGATSATYTLVPGDASKYIKFEVTPVASAGTSPGVAVSNTYTGPVLSSGTISWTPGLGIIYSSGHVGINTEHPDMDSYLTVNGKILAKEVEVVSSITSDFVFEPDYKLMSLPELEIYLKANKHLPSIPSIAEFSKQGQNLGKMDDLLLRKIEELTLYLIGQEKTIQDLQDEIKALKNSSKD
jgi:uncharacterized repeat protein (TIGR02543 family)